MEKKLAKKIIIVGKIETITGLHIGSTNSIIGIGGLDKLVVRNPIDNKPYIPGSSLKGKLRSLTDLIDGTIEKVNMGSIENGTSQNPNSISVQLFGAAKGDKSQPSRVIVRDGEILTPIELLKDTDLHYTESKTEVVIDRITAKAMPRTNERVPAGVEFKLDIILNVYSDDNQEEQLKNLKRAFNLLEDDYLGGNGSRGYGQIIINIESVEERDINFYAGVNKSIDITDKFKDL